MLPVTPGTAGLASVSSDMPSGASEKNWRAPGSVASVIGWLWMSVAAGHQVPPLTVGTAAPVMKKGS